MSRYRDYGQNDDPLNQEGDTYFRKVNARLRPNQLSDGEIQYSKNGRMSLDGTWQPRKGLATLSGSITTVASDQVPTLPVQLPFNLTATTNQQVFGACVFSDPTSELADDFIFTATDGVCVVLRASDKTTFKIKYPSGQGVNKRCDMLQAFNKVYLFRTNRTAFEIKPSLTTNPIVNATRNLNVITVEALNHGLNAGDFVTLTGLVGTEDPNDCYEVLSSGLQTNQFRVSLEGATGTETYDDVNGNYSFWNEFNLVKSGDYTMPDFITDTVSSVDGIITFSESNHGLELGQELTIVKSTFNMQYEPSETTRVTKINSADEFEVTLNVPDEENKTLTFSRKKPISYLVHQPSTPFAVVNQRRLWMPYFYEEDYSLANMQWTERGNKDEIIASDILDPDTYDVVGQRLRITGGSNDFVVGLEPFTEDTLLVFARRSVHKLTGVSGSLDDISVSVVTPDLGCSARRSIVQVGSKVLFLADQGIYALEYFDQYNLRGSEIPLSEAIQPIIDRINHRHVHHAVGAYFNNRYFLAVPLDNHVENSHVIVYNFINGGFESVDEVNSQAFFIRDMLVAREGRENNLYFTTSEGGIHRVEGVEGGDQISVQKGSTEVETIPVQSYIQTRDYDMNTMDRKYFTRSEIHLKGQDGPTDGTIEFLVTDPDSSTGPVTVNSLLENQDLPEQEDVSLRLSLRSRGYSASVKISPTKGRPLVRSVKLDARVGDRATTSKA